MESKSEPSFSPDGEKARFAICGSNKLRNDLASQLNP